MGLLVASGKAKSRIGFGALTRANWGAPLSPGTCIPLSLSSCAFPGLSCHQRGWQDLKLHLRGLGGASPGVRIVGKQAYHQPGLGSLLPHEAASLGFMRPPNLIQTNAAFHSKIKGAAV